MRENLVVEYVQKVLGSLESVDVLTDRSGGFGGKPLETSTFEVFSGLS